ncbi:MAG: hypothetical protein LUC33_06240 [Prevotellaceae bacterium]|nr:hypothetical protein [Prevotellaceae bacterium]
MTHERISRKECCRRIAEHVRMREWEDEFSPDFPITLSAVFTRYLRGCSIVYNSRHLGKTFPYLWGHFEVGWASFRAESRRVTLANLAPAESEDDTRARRALTLSDDELRALITNGRVAVYSPKTSDETYITLTEPSPNGATREAIRRNLRRDLAIDAKTLRPCLAEQQ